MIRSWRRTQHATLGVCLVVLLQACGTETGSPDSTKEAGAATDTPKQSKPLELSGGSTAKREYHDRGRFRFVDRTAESGLDQFQQTNGTADKLTILESIGGGVGLIDVDRDGDLDVYFANGSKTATPPTGALGDDVARDTFFDNDGTGSFTESSELRGVDDARWSMGVLGGDWDGDGWRDLYLLNFGPNRMLLNREGRFEDVGHEWGVDGNEWSCGAGFGDFDRDGDLDLYVSSYVDFDATWGGETPRTDTFRGAEVHYGPRGLPPMADRYYVNDGAGHFSDRSKESGILAATASFGFAVLPIDLNLDGALDIYVANDSVPNFLWTNQGDGKFKEGAVMAGLAVSLTGRAQAGMGAAAADFDGDALLDLFVTNFAMDSYTLYRGSNSGVFQDVTRGARLHRLTYDFLGWACGFEDFDLDGDVDLWTVNGHVYPQMDRFKLGSSYRQENLLFENDGAAQFSAPDGLGGSGFAIKASSRGTAVGDIDGDGDQDLLVGNLDGPPTLLVNEGLAVGNRVTLSVGTDGLEPIGARVELSSGEHTWLRVVGANVGFLSAHDPRIVIGVGKESGPFTLRVSWPDGSVTEKTGIEPNSSVQVSHE